MATTLAPRKKRTTTKRKKSAKRGERSRKRLIAADDLTKFQLLSDPQPSPDGSQVVFAHKQVGEKNEYHTNLWIVPSKGGDARPFTSGNRDRHPRWSPDGSQIAFIASREKTKPQLHIIPATGGEARQLTKFPEGSLRDFAWSPTGKHIAVSFREQHPDWTQEAKKQREEKGLTTPPRVIDEWWYRLDGDGYFGEQRFALYLVDVETGEHKKVYDKDTLGFFDYDFSPDGKEIALTTLRHKRALIEPWRTELVRLNVRTGKVKRVPNVPEGSKENVKWSPDGKYLAWAGREGRDSTYSPDNLHLWVCDATKGGARNFTSKEDYCLMANNIADTAEAVFGSNIRWSPDSKRIFMQIGWHGEQHIASIPRRGGTIHFHTRGEKVHQMGGLSDNGRVMGIMVGTSTTLEEVHVADPTQKRITSTALTNLNAPLLRELDLAKPKSQWVTSEDGTKVQTWVMTPPDNAPGGKRKKRPAILEIHGGPHAQYGVGFFHEFQLLAAQGYIVVFSNPRGSKGYGQDFCRAIRGSWGIKDWEDIQAVTKFMREHPDIDPKCMGVMGGSYGGYMTNWVIGHTREFKGAITDRCVSNLVSMYGNSDFPDRPDEYWEGNNWDRPETLWKHSPIQYMGNARTPTLIIHSEGDLRCNVEQAEQVFNVLKHHKVPCRFVRYPRETSHGMSRGGPPDMRLHRLGQIVEWWKKWLARIGPNG